MKSRPVRAICLLATMAVLGPAGCGRSPGPPPSLALEQIPAEMQKAFGKASPEVKDAVGRVNSALGSKDYPAAYHEVQALCDLPGETQEQRLLAARALLTITGLLQAEQAKGDQNAAAALKLRQMSR